MSKSLVGGQFNLEYLHVLIQKILLAYNVLIKVNLYAGLKGYTVMDITVKWSGRKRRECCRKAYHHQGRVTAGCFIRQLTFPTCLSHQPQQAGVINRRSTKVAQEVKLSADQCRSLQVSLKSDNLYVPSVLPHRLLAFIGFSCSSPVLQTHE